MKELERTIMIFCLDFASFLKKPIAEIIEEEEGEKFFEHQKHKSQKLLYSLSAEQREELGYLADLFSNLIEAAQQRIFEIHLYQANKFINQFNDEAMWHIYKNIATYRTGKFCIVDEIRLLDNQNGSFSIENENIFFDENMSNEDLAEARKELYAKIKKIGIDEFKMYSFIKCCMCESLTPRRKGKDVCSTSCRVALTRLKSDILDHGDFSDVSEGLFYKFKNGSLHRHDDFYSLVYKDTSCKIIKYEKGMVSVSGSLIDLDSMVEPIYRFCDEEGDCVGFYDIKGDVNFSKLKVVFKTAFNILDNWAF